MTMFADPGFYKRAQIVAAATSRWPAWREFADLDRLTIFADNLVPHVLRCDGVLRYDDAPGRAHRRGPARCRMDAREREIRACAVHACELLAARLGVAPRALDTWLWNRGQGDGATRRAPATARAPSTTERAAQPPAGFGPRTGPQRADVGRAARLARRPDSSATARSSAPIRLASPLIASAIGSGRWTQSASGPSGRLPVDAHRVAGVADDGRVRRHVVDDDGVGADLRAVADR